MYRYHHDHEQLPVSRDGKPFMIMGIIFCGIFGTYERRVGAMVVQERLSLRNLYLYLVCLITLIITIFATVNLVRSAAELLYPDPGYYGAEPIRVEPDGTESQLSVEDRERLEKAGRYSQRRQAVLGLIGSATTLLIAGPVYAYHWRRVQTELPPRQPPGGAEPPVG
jgi:hypothetical protein